MRRAFRIKSCRLTQSADVLSFLSRHWLSRSSASVAVQLKPRDADWVPSIAHSVPICLPSTSQDATRAEQAESAIKNRDYGAAWSLLHELSPTSWHLLDRQILAQLCFHSAFSQYPQSSNIRLMSKILPGMILNSPNDEKLFKAALLFFVQHDMRECATQLLASRPHLRIIDTIAQDVFKHLSKSRTNWKILQYRLGIMQRFLGAYHEHIDSLLPNWTPHLFHYHLLSTLNAMPVQDIRLFLVQNDNPLSVCEGFKSRITPLSATFDLLLEAYLSNYNLVMARRLLQLRTKAGYVPNSAMYIAMLRGYRHLGGHSDLFGKVLADAEGLQLRHNLEVLHGLLDIHIKDKEYDKAWQVFLDLFDVETRSTDRDKERTSTKVKPNADTFALLIKACMKSEQDSNARARLKVLSQLMSDRQIVLNTGLAEALIEQDLSNGNLKRARLLLESLFRHSQGADVTSPVFVPFPTEHAIILGADIHSKLLQSVLEQSGLKAGLDLWAHWDGRAVRSNYKLLTILVQFYARTRSHALAQFYLQLCDRHSNEVKRNVTAFKLLCHWTVSTFTYRRHKLWPALAKMGYMITTASLPPVDTEDMPTALKDPSLPKRPALGMAPLVQSSKVVALQMSDIAHTDLSESTPDKLWTMLRDRIVNAGFRPSTAHLMAILTSYYRLNNFTKALEALDTGFNKLGIVKTAEPYTLVILMHLRGGKYEVADALYQSMQAEGVQPDHRLARVMMIPLCKQKGTFPKEFRKSLNDTITSSTTSLSDKKVALDILFREISAELRRSKPHLGQSRMQKAIWSALSAVEKAEVAEIVDGILSKQFKRESNYLLRQAKKAQSDDQNDTAADFGGAHDSLQKSRTLVEESKAQQNQLYSQLETLIETALFSRPLA